MSVLVAVLLVAMVGWVFAKAARATRTGAADRLAAPAQPAWPGETMVATRVPAPTTADLPDLRTSVRAASPSPPPRTPAQAATATPRGRYALSSQPQRRRADRSAWVFARARGPGLCSPQRD